jgi:hypothetical protein
MNRAGSLAALVIPGALALGLAQAGQAPAVQFVFTSDAHYGIARPEFRGAAQVDARIVNAALVRSINAVTSATFPDDGGMRAGERVGNIDFVVEGGDIANRAERSESGQIQDAAASWAQFRADYVDGLTVTDWSGRRSPLYVVPGNHEASNAVGFYAPMVPATDKTALTEVFNLMMRPATPRTAAAYDYANDKVLTSRDVGGIRFLFLTVWPDSQNRAWMEANLAQVAAATPVALFVHDQPDGEAKHFINPNGAHDINARDRFENLLADTFADGPVSTTPALIERRALEGFLRAHPNVAAYFHGNANWHQAYDWTGPDGTVGVHAFRVDSPMKGAKSSRDERRLSFQVVTIDPSSKKMTVRECLWNADPAHPADTWGESTTVSLQPERDAAVSELSPSPASR